MNSKKTKQLFSLKNFSGREAMWLAILLHLIFLFLPQSMNPFLLFWKDFEAPRPEPIAFTFKPPIEQPQEEQPEITEAPEKHEAVTTEKSQEPPETKQPQVQGQTNQKTMEAPPATRPEVMSQPEKQEQTPKETGKERSEEPKKEMEKKTSEEALEYQRKLEKQRAENLAKALKDFPNLQPSEMEMTYNNDRPSSADEVDNFIQFDTYDWNYEPYRAKMIRKLYRFWVPKLYEITFFRMGAPGQTVYRFYIRRDGSIRTMELLRPSDHVPYDQAASHSIRAPYPGLSTAFPALPVTFHKEELGVTIGFFVNTERRSKGRE